MISRHPSSDDPATVPVQFLKGVGPRKAELLAGIGIKVVMDLFFYVPRRYIDRTTILPITRLWETAAGQLVAHEPPTPTTAGVRQDATVLGNVRSFRVIGAGKRARFVLVLGDRTGSMQCVWFGGVQYWKRAFRVGEALAVSGQPTFYRSTLQFIHPAFDRIAAADTGEAAEPGAVDWQSTLNTGGMVPLYPSGQELERAGLDSGGFRRVIASALRHYLDGVQETLTSDILSSRRLPGLQAAIRAAHFPSSRAELDAGIRRLKYEELFLFQLTLALKRLRRREVDPGIRFDIRSTLARKLVDSLPFVLTDAQVRVIREITADMESPRPMNRLLQGDVGSGKTIVALIAMAIAVENGYQSVFAAPTEILAEQHFKTLTALAHGLPLSLRLLIGAQRSRLRNEILEDVRCGTAQIVVGTHALFEKDVEFAKLGFVVIDEQHRFGVLQRAALRGKGEHPDVLVMTATPIPRTLSLTLFGDLDVSVITALPRGRRPIKTVLRGDDERESVHDFVRSQIARGRQAYFVSPLVEESEKLDLKAATARFQELRKTFPELRIDLIHGRLASDEKDAVMKKFYAGETDILAATTVIEVGIDVPNASIMVIENADRFGLAQLHQLRGRVGRGGEQSFCILIAPRHVVRNASRISDPSRGLTIDDQERLAERRLAAMVSTTDGFAVAELDLRLRGPGDFFGTRQSGMPEFKVADVVEDADVLDEARADAFALVERDPRLALPEHHALALHIRSRERKEFLLAQIG